MLVCMENINALGREIQRHLGERTQSWLAERTGLKQGTISRIVRGEVMPTPKNIELIAKALEVDTVYLFRLAGLPIPASEDIKDPSVKYLAQRLDALPEEVRSEAVDALGGQLDAIYRVAGIKPAKQLVEDITKDYPDLTPTQDIGRLLRILKNRDPELYEALMTGKLIE
jgi:transcriptional regulator with XRE-family HTH domain